MNDSSLGYKKGIKREYSNMYTILGHDYRFLYAYAYELYNLGQYKLAHGIIIECQKKIADYDVCLLMGDIYLELKDESKAIDNYTQAHHMCPNRFAPLCAIYDVYKQQGQLDKCRLLALSILSRNIKVHSSETMEYIDYIKKEFEELSDTTMLR